MFLKAMNLYRSGVLNLFPLSTEVELPHKKTLARLLQYPRVIKQSTRTLR